MADLTIRRGAGGGANLAQNDPFHLVRESMRRMQDLFRDPLLELDPIAYVESGRLAQFVPDFEVRETRDGLVFNADLPGVKDDDLEITVVGNRLRINGKRELQQESRGDTWYAAERAYGSFARTFILPDGCDTSNVTANLENGVLTVQLPKREEAQPRRINLGGRQPAIEGQYHEGPFQQSQAGAPAGAAGAHGGANAPGAPGYSMYGNTPPASASKGYGAAAGGFEHGEQAGGGVKAGETPNLDNPDKKRR